MTADVRSMDTEELNEDKLDEMLAAQETRALHQMSCEVWFGAGVWTIYTAFRIGLAEVLLPFFWLYLLVGVFSILAVYCLGVLAYKVILRVVVRYRTPHSCVFILSLLLHLGCIAVSALMARAVYLWAMRPALPHGFST